MWKVTALLALATAASARRCTNLTIPISISARNAIFDIAAPTTEVDVTNFFLNNARSGFNYTEQILGGYYTVHGSYHLETTLCIPDKGPGNTLQILTHGVGFDRSYWDPAWKNGNYSYVAKAVDEFGYATVAWDRLGIGASSHGDPLNEIQASLELSALYELTRLFSSGGVRGVETAYVDVVHVGHSFGSVLTYSLANRWPACTGAVALTGFSQVPAFLGEFALGAGFVPAAQVPALAPEYAPGYYAPQSKVGVQTNFFAPGDFDPDVLELAYETGQPFAAGEALTVLAGTDTPNVFNGPVLIITGNEDVPFCGGNCSATTALPSGTHASNLIQYSKKFFKKASAFNATIVPGAGHGLNYGYSHTTTFATILDFLETHASHGKQNY